MKTDQQNDLKFWLAINKSMEFKPQTFFRLLRELKSAKNIWMAPNNVLKNYLTEKKLNNFVKKKGTINPDLLEEILLNLKIIPITINDDNYPKLLKEIADPPPLIYIKGNFAILNEPCLAIVGSRKATNSGKNVTRNISKKLSQRGIVIVSGIAEGIDSEAHLGALDVCGKTIAVLGNSLEYIYPSFNRFLAEKIINTNGVLISENFPYTKTEKYHFVARNRIISGLSKGVLVTEASQKSGALITANFALEQNRNVYSIPGDITKDKSIGTNNLLKEGAKLVSNVNDILEDFNLPTFFEKLPSLTQLEALIMEALNEPKTIDEIFACLKDDHSVITETISLLELKGLIKNNHGQIYK